MLWASAPHIIWPLRLVLPHHKGLRPAWFLRLGLFVYDYLGGRKLLPATRTLDMRDRRGRQAAEAALHQGVRILRLLGQRRAAGGAQCARCRRSRRDHPHPHHGGLGAPARTASGSRACATRRPASTETVEARLLVNAAGPVGRSRCCRGTLGQNSVGNVRLVQGSHIVVKQALRARPLLLVPERRWPDHLRHPLRGRVHADRHHRPGLRGRSRATCGSATARSTTSARRRASISPSR